jgi:hypothetical protein
MWSSKYYSSSKRTYSTQCRKGRRYLTGKEIGVQIEIPFTIGKETRVVRLRFDEFQHRNPCVFPDTYSRILIVRVGVESVQTSDWKKDSEGLRTTGKQIRRRIQRKINVLGTPKLDSDTFAYLGSKTNYRVETELCR